MRPTLKERGILVAVRRTAKSGLRQIDFEIDGQQFRGLEQNLSTKSQWAQLARSGKKVMQFLQNCRYVANVADVKVTVCGWWKPPSGIFSATSKRCNCFSRSLFAESDLLRRLTRVCQRDC